MPFSAVIAAAGLSSRMHEFKPLTCIGRMTFIQNVVRTLKKAGAQDIIVVSGYRAETLKNHLEGEGVIPVENTDYASTTMFDSLCLGLNALPRPAEGVFLMPGDVPLVKSETISAIAASGAKIARPVFEGKIGHPTWFAAECIPSILNYSGENGLRGAIAAMELPITDIEVDDRGVLLDADTPADMKALRLQALRNRGSGQLWMDMQIRIGRGENVITHESVQLLEMVGVTGSIQTACACMHMSYTKGWMLLNDMEKGLSLPLTQRSVGGSEGGGTGLTEAGKKLVQSYNLFTRELQQQAQARFRELFAFAEE